ncbi:MAG: hypothetical protein Q4C98_05960 [Capnocytophaga sp.]|nr:hypothetical protein [Capnocytophaga sp.]
MNKFTILNVANITADITSVSKKHKNIHFETVSDVEQAIEKLHGLTASVIFIHSQFPEEETNKLNRIGKLLHPEIEFLKTDFSNLVAYEDEVLQLWKQHFKRKMARYNIEDNPNLNNPFLNIDKTNIFN